MARAAQCDRCGKCYPLEDLDTQTVKIHEVGIPADLCNDCYKQLELWYNDKDARFWHSARSEQARWLEGKE